MKTKRRNWALKEFGQLMKDGFLPFCDTELSHGRWAGIHGKNELCTSDCCCISHNYIFITSPVISLGLISYASHHILAEIIFNWFFPSICESFKGSCLFFLSPDRAGTLNFLERKMMRVMILMKKLMWNSLWESGILRGRLEESLWMLIFILYLGDSTFL